MTTEKRLPPETPPGTPGPTGSGPTRSTGSARGPRAGQVVRVAAAPQRTCVGCRARADRSSLLRVVVADAGGAATAAVLEPDPLARRPGRGSWVHSSQDCLDRAVRRRAFVRALRLRGPVDVEAVREHLTTTETGAPAGPSRSASSTSSGSGSRQMGTR